MTENHTSLRDDLDRVPALGNVERALAQGTRVRRRRALGTVAASVVAVSGLSVALAFAGTDNPSVSPAAPTDDQYGLTSDIVIGERVTEWVPENELVGAPAPVGTAVAATCDAGGGCTYSLINDEGRTDLASVSPDLVGMLDQVGVENTSLSHDGRYLAIAIDGGIRIQPLDAVTDELPITVEPAASGSEWRLVAWGSGSLNASLVETGPSGMPTRYGLLDLSSFTISTVDANAAQDLVPVGHFGIGPYLARADTASDGSQLTLAAMAVEDQQGYLNAGQVENLDASPGDVSDFLMAGETILGPDGAPEVRTPPGENTAWPRLTVFESTGGTPSAVAVIVLEDGAPYRIDLTGNCAGGELLGELRPETFACVTKQGGQSTLGFTGQQPNGSAVTDGGNTTWLVPGQTRTG